MGESNTSTGKADSPAPSDTDAPAPAETDATAAANAPAASSEPAAAAPSDAPVTTDVAEADAAPVEGAAKPKKKKKRRKDAPAAERDPLGPDGRERPAFVLDYPSDPELDRLVKAFELGNYAFVREHAPALAKKAPDERVRAAAGELARRIEPDPLIKVLLGMSIALFVVLALWAYKTHGN